MDTVVTSAGAGSWSLEDRLARTLGTITLSNEGQFLIRPVHGKLSGIKTGPFTSLDLAMVEIESDKRRVPAHNRHVSPCPTHIPNRS